MRKHAALAVAMGTIFLCDSCASLRGAWYYQTREASVVDSAGDASKERGATKATDDKTNARCDDAGLYFAVVNDTHAAITVTKVQINGSQAGDAGWTCSGRQLVRRGQLLVLKLPVEAAARCAVPLQAWLWGDESRMPASVRVSDGMPSALPGVWLQCPAATAETCASNAPHDEAMSCKVATGSGPESE